jgi:hypothetical protein
VNMFRFNKKSFWQAILPKMPPCAILDPPTLFTYASSLHNVPNQSSTMIIDRSLACCFFTNRMVLWTIFILGPVKQKTLRSESLVPQAYC